MKAQIIQAIKKTLDMLMHAGKLPTVMLPEILVERPKDDQFGDYTTNIALLLAKPCAMPPREVAELIQAGLTLSEIERIDVAGPGHLNFTLKQEEIFETVGQVLTLAGRFGNSMYGGGEKVNNEFISANPTGPLHLGNGRGGFYADTLSRVLRKAGYAVTNEYYVNDAGEQTIKLGHSVLKDEEAVYAGEYIEALNAKIKNQKSKWEVKEAGEWAAQEILETMIKPTVREVMRVHFDTWTSERQLMTDGYIDKALALLAEKKLTFESEGAVWLRTTEFGDDKDRVLVKQDGSKTYFASDCGYILQKMERGFTTMIETWGADHHGYIGRFRAAAQALGFDSEKIHFVIVQLVRLMKDGVEVRMSKRAGNVVAIDELIEKVGHDVARFFFLLYSPDTHMNFDLGLAEERSEKNPVFYVQYAYARLASILRKAEEAGLKATTTNFALLTRPKERLLVRELLAFPELIEYMAEEKIVHPLPQYAVRLADRLHSFYADCRVIDMENLELSGARLSLIQATKVVLGESLRLIGVEAPEEM